jgi:hypothetical protein
LNALSIYLYRYQEKQNKQLSTKKFQFQVCISR